MAVCVVSKVRLCRDSADLAIIACLSPTLWGLWCGCCVGVGNILGVWLAIPSSRTRGTDTVSLSLSCVAGLVTETSVLDADEGIRYRGLTLFDCKEQLPSAPGGTEMLPEGVFWLLLTGEVPTAEQSAALSREWAARADVPTHVTDMINAFPSTLHPMAQFSAAVTALHSESIFAQEYHTMPKTKYWEATYEDSMNLIAKLPTVAAMIYRNVFKDGQMACIDPDKVIRFCLAEVDSMCSQLA